MDFVNNNINFLRIKQLVIRYITIISVLGVSATFAPNFNFQSFPILLIAGFAVVTLDYLVSTITGIHDMRIGRGIVGFVSATIIIYLVKYIVAGYYISFLSSTITALIYSVIDYYLPNKE